MADQTWQMVLAGFINTTAVLIVVQLLRNYVLPFLNLNLPWFVPILTGAVGPGVALIQNMLAAWLGVPIDLSPIVAVFTGLAAVAANQTVRNGFREDRRIRKLIG